MRRFTCIFLLILLLLSSVLTAQNYSLRGSVREWIKNYTHEPRDRGLMETRVRLELLSTMGEYSAFKVKSYYVYDGLNKTGEWDFQEAYIDFYYEWADIRLGKQIVAWGKADELNPTDVLNPQNLGNITEEKNIRKKGLMMFKSDIYLGENNLTLIWKPEFGHYSFPVNNPRISLFAIPNIGAVDPTMPENKLSSTEWAVKWSRTFGLYDVSAAYFDGWDNIFTPSFVYILNRLGEDVPVVDELSFLRTKMYSVDFAGSMQSFGVWGEIAYFRTSDPDGEDPFIKNPYVQMVFGTDYTFMNGLKVNVQFMNEYITNIDNDIERNAEEAIISRLGMGLPIRRALASRLSKAFGSSEQHSMEMFGIYDIEKEGYILQPKVKLSPEDALVFELGLALYGGKMESMFGNFGKNDELYLKAEFSF
ncbi:hypothetical protein ACFL67_00030 [candidate division KSB1 bacterium]